MRDSSASRTLKRREVGAGIYMHIYNHTAY